MTAPMSPSTADPVPCPGAPREGRGRRRSPRSPTALIRAEREANALRLHSQGETYEKIAEELGVANKSVAHKIVARALKRVPSSAVFAHRSLELDRFQMMKWEVGRRLGWGSPLGRESLRFIPGYEEHYSLIDFVDEILETEGHDESAWPCSTEDGLVDRSSSASRRSGQPRRSTSDAARAVLDGRALALRCEGHTFDSIARQLGVANRSVASKMVDRAARRTNQEHMGAYRANIEAELLHMELHYLELIMNGHMKGRAFWKAIKFYGKVSDRRRRLLRLDPKPGTAHLEGNGSIRCDSDVLEREFCDNLKILLRWRSNHPSPDSPLFDEPDDAP